GRHGQPAAELERQHDAEWRRDRERDRALLDDLGRRILGHAGRALLADLGDVDDQRLDHGEHHHADHDRERERPAEATAERRRRVHSDTTNRIPAPRTVSIATGKPCSFLRRWLRWTSITLVPGSNS